MVGPGSPAEAEQLAAQRIVPQHLLHLQRQRRKALAHIRVARRQAHANTRRQQDHRCRSTLITRPSTTAPTSLPAINRQPPGSSMSIEPAIDAATAGTNLAPPDPWTSVPHRRHVNSRLGLTSCRLAAIDTDALRSKLSATFRRRSSSDLRCRRTCRLPIPIPLPSQVSIGPKWTPTLSPTLPSH